MSVTLNLRFAGIACEPAKARASLEEVGRTLEGAVAVRYVSVATTLPSGCRQRETRISLDTLAHLADGKESSLSVIWDLSGGRTFEVFLHWLAFLACDISAPDEASAERAMGIITRGLGLQTLDNPADASVRHVASPLAEALRSHDKVLHERYVQAGRDIKGLDRLAYHGPIHELRDVLANVLRDLAPDQQVRGQDWYRQDPNMTGPTQVQRAKYILTVLRSRPSNAVDVARDAIAAIDAVDAVSSLARNTYSRASAAHRAASRDEATQILRYVETILGDLLGVH